jgi:hypothetical protein
MSRHPSSSSSSSSSSSDMMDVSSSSQSPSHALVLSSSQAVGVVNSLIPSSSSGHDQSSTIDLARHPSGLVPKLQNLVATLNLGTKLDLKAIALRARNAEYNPKVSRANGISRKINDRFRTVKLSSQSSTVR